MPSALTAKCNCGELSLLRSILKQNVSHQNCPYQHFFSCFTLRDCICKDHLYLIMILTMNQFIQPKRIIEGLISNYYFYYKWHRFLLPIQHPVIRLDYNRRGTFRFIIFYCCNCLGFFCSLELC